MAEQTYRIHELDINDALNFGGILAGGGLAGQASRALSEFESNGASAAAINAFLSLLMGSLANPQTRDEIRSLLFDLWKTTEDEQALERDLNMQGRLKPVYDGDEIKKDSPYYRKLKRFHKLPPVALVGLGKALYQSDGFKDFLESLSMVLPTDTIEQATSSNGITDLHPVK